MNLNANPRHIIQLRSGWHFLLADVPDAAFTHYDDTTWTPVTVPHDWAIAGPFHREHDLQYTKIIENGEQKPFAHTGRTGALPHPGVGWYRYKFQAPQAWQGKRIFIEFDGVMSHSSIYLNGTALGGWPYGYTSFSIELTDYISYNLENVLAVRVDNKPGASRWYPGAGIYRHVRLVITNPVHVGHCGTWVTTQKLTQQQATIHVRTETVNQTGEPQTVRLVTNLYNPCEQLVSSTTTTQQTTGQAVFSQTLSIDNPILWDTENPQLYQAVSQVYIDGKISDTYETTFGMRTVRYDANQGLYINEQPIKIRGVCMHHDVGALGTAVNRHALRRQLEILRDMGCNAIRTSHNPPAPELLELCDSMGFLVIDEAFDEWLIGKTPNGYHTLFPDWAEKDLCAMIRRDRNHPCIIMWSIGNEVGEQRTPDGAKVGEFLTGICHREDPTRPVTIGLSVPDKPIANGLADAVDIQGWNYKPHLYERYHREHPDWVIYGSETASCVSSRGEYYFPVTESRNGKQPTLHVTSYDVTAPSWASPPDYEFAAQDDCPFILGEFVWTGFDYLGEPTPYETEWPSRSSYFGIVDLCGFPKDRYYLYRSRWCNEPTLHLLPHWNWEGKEGENIPVYCYTNYPAAELFLNGKSLGVRRKHAATVFTRYRLMWENVQYEPGVLQVVAYDQADRPIASTQVVTASAAYKIELSPNKHHVTADGDDLVFVSVRIVDNNGHLCPWADHLVDFALEGSGTIRAVDNGDPTSLESFQAKHRRAFHGVCMVVISTNASELGTITLRAEAEGLLAAHVNIQAM